MSHDSAHSADDIASEIQVTRVKYNQYTLYYIKSSSKMVENMQGYDKKSTFFLERHFWKHLLV